MSRTLLEQGDVALLDEPIAQALLTSKVPARLAYTWRDGTPRVVAIWFHWDGRQIVMASPPKAPKLKVLGERPDVALTIDDSSGFPYKELLIRGKAELQPWDDVVPEYALASRRYLGEEAAATWLAQLKGAPMVRVAVTPTWVGLIDFVSRMPSALT